MTNYGFGPIDACPHVTPEIYIHFFWLQNFPKPLLVITATIIKSSISIIIHKMSFCNDMHDAISMSPVTPVTGGHN